MQSELSVTLRPVAVSCDKHSSYVPAWYFQYFCTLGGWCVSRQVNWEKRDELQLGHLFYAPLFVEQALLSLKRRLSRPGCCRMMLSSQVNIRRSGLGLRPPVTYFTCLFTHFQLLQGLEVFVGQGRVIVLSACAMKFLGGVQCSLYWPPSFTPVVRLLLRRKLERWQWGPWVIGFMSHSPCPRWIAC